jgi:molybdopterin/thiamine biosynthesis adenylyltransferase
MAGVIGTLQAAEAIKYFLGMDLLSGRLLSYNALTMDFRTVSVKADLRCPVCGAEPSITTLIDYEQAVCDLKTH